MRGDTWFLTLVSHILGHNYEAEKVVLDGACLLSNRGRSVFVSTISDADPTFIDPGYFSVARGVPCRHRIRKTGILDGPEV